MRQRALGIGLAWVAAFAAAGCTGDPEPADDGGSARTGGGVVLKAYPVAGDWTPMGSPLKYSANADDLDPYVGESRGAQLRANTLDSLLVKQYAHEDWDKPTGGPGDRKDIRRIRVELFLHQMSVGAGRTFQNWHSGKSINDLGEKAFAESDAITFLRGSVLVRLVPTGPWIPGDAAKPTVQVGKAIDAWLQGK